MERLQKVIAQAGVASRRKAEELITEGKVKVNGKVVTELGTKVDPKKDIVEFEGIQVAKNEERKKYILLNKPIGYVTTASDQFGRDTVGDFVFKVTHPKHEIEKTYNVTLRGIIRNEEVEELRNGVIIDEDYKTKPAKVRILKTDEEKNESRIEVTIHEGRNRQVRKMCEAINKKVLALHRSRIESIDVKNLPIGKWRFLKDYEIEKILSKCK